MLKEIGKVLFFTGIIFFIIGTILILIENIKIPFLKKIGNLPGDIKIKGKNFIFYFPLTTSIIISILLSLIFFFIKIIIKK
ncbi:MAG: DUF2905 domain-containing protein [Spirochaetes bacterium]|nr:DUF2905 domain-containing protein [Spirochaetota bacterium]